MFAKLVILVMNQCGMMAAIPASQLLLAIAAVPDDQPCSLLPVILCT
jgi:hypothetical protein